MEKNKIVSYVLSSDEKHLIIITLMVNPSFGEVGQYTDEEAKKVVDFLSKEKVPKFKDKTELGYKTYAEWDEFVKENTLKIKELLK